MLGQNKSIYEVIGICFLLVDAIIVAIENWASSLYVVVGSVAIFGYEVSNKITLWFYLFILILAWRGSKSILWTIRYRKQILSWNTMDRNGLIAEIMEFLVIQGSTLRIS